MGDTRTFGGEKACPEKQKKTAAKLRTAAVAMGKMRKKSPSPRPSPAPPSAEEAVAAPAPAENSVTSNQDDVLTVTATPTRQAGAPKNSAATKKSRPSRRFSSIRSSAGKAQRSQPFQNRGF